jgi:hypothetical protein
MKDLVAEAKSSLRDLTYSVRENTVIKPVVDRYFSENNVTIERNMPRLENQPTLREAETAMEPMPIVEPTPVVVEPVPVVVEPLIIP